MIWKYFYANMHQPEAVCTLCLWRFLTDSEAGGKDKDEASLSYRRYHIIDCTCDDV